MNLIYTKPLRHMLVRDRYQRLEFVKGDPAQDGIYRIMGGIAWPDPAKGTRGFALTLGRDIKRKVAHVMAEHWFDLIESAGTETGIQPLPCLSDFLSLAWAYYGCDTYYWIGREVDFMGQVRRVLQSKIIKPTPILPICDWLDERGAMAAIYEADQCGRLKYASKEDHGMVHQALLDHATNHLMTPELAALAAVLAGLEIEGDPKNPPHARAELDNSFAGLVK